MRSLSRLRLATVICVLPDHTNWHPNPLPILNKVRNANTGAELLRQGRNLGSTEGGLQHQSGDAQYLFVQGLPGRMRRHLWTHLGGCEFLPQWDAQVHAVQVKLFRHQRLSLFLLLSRWWGWWWIDNTDWHYVIFRLRHHSGQEEIMLISKTRRWLNYPYHTVTTHP